MNKRNTCAALANSLGLLRLAEARPKGNALLVLNYHRMGDPATTPFDEASISATPAEFEAQVRWIQRHNGVVGMAEALDLLLGGRPFRGVPVLLTFDDGYRDNYQLAFPILRSLGAVATFFLVSSYIGSRTIPWWDQIAWLVRESPRAKIQLRYPTFFECQLPPGRRFAETVRVLKHFKKGDPGGAMDSDRYLNELREACGLLSGPSCDEIRFLTWDEAREMLRGGMTIGSHTHSHRMLSHLTPEEQAEEIGRSATLLREGLGQAIDTFSYPVGTPKEASPAARAALKKNGYRAAFTYYGGINAPNGDPYNIERVPVEPVPFSRFRMQLALAPHTKGSWF